MKRTIISATYLTLVIALSLTLPSCHRSNNTDGAKLEFSADTVLFDTVFTTVTSSTRTFTVRNTTGAPVEVDIALAGGREETDAVLR